MKLRFALAATLTILSLIIALPVNVGRAYAAGSERAPKVDWETLPVGIATTIATLTPDEQSKITAIESKLKADITSAKVTDPRPAVATHIRTLDEQAGAEVKTILTTDQIAAIEADAPLFTLLKTTVGFRSDALDQLSLTADQISKLKDIATDYDAKQKAIEDEARAKSTELKAATKIQATALLTADQNALLAEHHGRVKK